MSKLNTLSRFRAALASTFQKKVMIFRPATPRSSRILQQLLNQNRQINLEHQEIASIAVKDFGCQSLQIQQNIRALTERTSFKSSRHFLPAIQRACLLTYAD